MSIFSRLLGSRQEPITLVRFNELRTAEPRRLRFGSSQKLSRGNGGPATGFLNLTFRETIERILPCDLARKDGRYGPYAVIRSEAEYAKVESWINENKDLVFIRSLLSTCVALGEHQSSPGVRTELGELERRAKYEADKSARASLLEKMEEVYNRLLDELDIDSICAVPPSEPGKFCLPARLSSKLSERLGLEDLTPHLSWAGTKPPLKEVEVDLKWQRLEAVGLNVSVDVKGRNVLIIDDLYQSGATVHFVASKLQMEGASELHCLAVVKSLSDTDNT
jgi:hypothetical protein